MTVFEVVAAHAPAVILSQTGVLEPGDYTLSVEISASGYGAQGPYAGDGRSSANFIFSVESAACPADTWTDTSITGAPSGRHAHSAVWTGKEMIVWGGLNTNASLNTGGRYNPTTDTWAAMSTTNAPEVRGGHTAIWTGTEMIVWGGVNDGRLNSGGRYNPITDSWVAITSTNAPAARNFHTAVWTGSEMIVWGGLDNFLNVLNTGGRYNPSTDTWVATPLTGAPAGRDAHTAVWTGREMIVWGGYDGSSTVNSGGRYSPITNNWTATSTINTPLRSPAPPPFGPGVKWSSGAVVTATAILAWEADTIQSQTVGLPRLCPTHQLGALIAQQYGLAGK